MMEAIGGYFELELNNDVEYHKNALKLNTGRNCLEYILRVKNYKKIYIPYYTCEVILEPIKKLKISFEFYYIDKNLNPVFEKKIQTNEAFLYTNYFGIKQTTVKQLAAKFGENLIIDNAQAFFDKPLKNIDTFYSARKFFGVPDGAYLYTNKKFEKKLEQDISYKRFEHLLGRIDLGAEQFYQSFKNNDASLIEKPIKTMSNLTCKILRSINYQKIKKRRCENFLLLHNTLKNTNQLNLEIEPNTVPMVYPYFVNNGSELKKKLIQNKIFVATYWTNVFNLAKENSFEYKLAKYLLPLPIDQRYKIEDMKRIINLLSDY